MIKYPLTKFILPKYEPQQRIINLKTNKRGKILSLRLDEYEKEHNWPKNKFHYCIRYDDLTLEIYEKECNILNLTDN